MTLSKRNLGLVAVLLVSAAGYIGYRWSRLPAIADREKGLENLPIASYTGATFDDSLVLISAPLPKPCKKDQSTAVFCLPPSNLTLSRARYDSLRTSWGERTSPVSRFLLLWQAGSSEWHLILSPDDAERPLAWFEPDASGTVRLWPVYPAISRLQTLNNESLDVAPDGPESLRIRFPKEAVGKLRRWSLSWQDPHTLVIRFIPVTGLPRVLLDPGHGAADSGAKSGDLVEAELNLKLALRLETVLKKKGFPVGLSRRTDVAVTLAERYRLATSGDYDFLLSLHNDWYPTEIPWMRSGCLYARPDLEDFCHEMTRDAWGNPSAVSHSATERRFLLMTLAPFIPSVLLENLNLKDTSDRELASSPSRFDVAVERWARQIADRLEASFPKK